MRPRTGHLVAVGLSVTALGALASAPARGAAWAPDSPVGVGANDAPAVAGSAGSAVAAWPITLDATEDTSSIVVAAKAPGQAPGTAAVVSGADAATLPAVAGNATGTIAVGFTSDNAGGDSSVTLRTYQDGALVDTDVVPPAATGDTADEAEVAVAPDGSVLLAWIAGVSPTTARAVVRRPDGTLTAPIQLSNTSDASELEVAADATGFITTFVRTSSDQATTSVEVVRVPLSGGSTAPVTLASGTLDNDDRGGLLSSPQIAAGGGRAIVAYAEDFTDPSDNNFLTIKGAIGTVAGGVGTSASTLSGAGQILAESPAVAAGPNGTLAVSYADAGGAGSTNLTVAAPGAGFAAPQAIAGASNRADLAVLPDGSVLAGVLTSRLEGILRAPSGAVASQGFADPGAAGDGTIAGDGIGNVATAYAVPPLGSVGLTAFDAAPPRIGSVDAPDRGRVGQRLDFRSSGAADDWSAIAGTAWAFGDGATANGANVSHTYTSAGRYGAGITVTDAAGNAASRSAGTVVVSAEDGTPPPAGPVQTNPTPAAAPPPPAPGQDVTAPVLGKVALSRSVFRVASGSTAFASAASIRAGAEARFRTLEPGLVRVVIAKLADLPSMRSTCTAAGLPLRSKTAGKRRVTFEKILGAGTHRIRLTGRSGGRALPRGRYELRVSVADTAGNRSKAQVARFTLC